MRRGRLRDRLFKAERIADGHHRLADLKGVRIPDGDDRQPRGLDFQQGQVRLGITPDHLRGQLAAVRQLDLDPGRVLDDMIVGHDVAVSAQDEARAHGSHGAPRSLFEEALEEVLGGALAGATLEVRDRPARGPAAGADVHHGGLRALAEAHPVRSGRLRALSGRPFGPDGGLGHLREAEMG